AYFNSADNCSYVYPYFDILQVIPPEMDVRTFNFYFLADEKHNPSRGSVWVGTPYVDPAGQGWMVSVIAPVYEGDTLLGVVGTDLTVHTLTQKYLESAEKPSLLVNHDGLVIATSSEAARILHLPIQEGHKYIEAVNTDTFQPEKFNLLKSPRKPIRALARSIIIEKQSRGWIEMHGERQLVIAAPVPETNWTLWQIIAE
ncbi:MAG TPA: Cache sensor signal transduction histidine kinase, partial [Bacteroidetes bacterium]|nr:Cache sensor signal transduction histidine kinase [Bacteroidota bacterium]